MLLIVDYTKRHELDLLVIYTILFLINSDENVIFNPLITVDIFLTKIMLSNFILRVNKNN